MREEHLVFTIHTCTGFLGNFETTVTVILVHVSQLYNTELLLLLDTPDTPPCN